MPRQSLRHCNRLRRSIGETSERCRNFNRRRHVVSSPVMYSMRFKNSETLRPDFMPLRRQPSVQIGFPNASSFDDSFVAGCQLIAS